MTIGHTVMLFIIKSYSLPLFWSEEQISLLPSKCRFDIETEIENLKKCFHQCQLLLKLFASSDYSIDYDSYLWAYATVKTRNVHVGAAEYLEKGGNEWKMPNWIKSSSYDSSCLVPYFDMLNNDCNICNSYTYNRRDQQFEIKCKGRGSQQALLQYYIVDSNCCIIVNLIPVKAH